MVMPLIPDRWTSVSLRPQLQSKFQNTWSCTDKPHLRKRNSCCYLMHTGNKSIQHPFLHCRSQTLCEMSDSEDDDIPQLSAHTLAALQEFYAEQKQSIDPGEGDKYSVGIIEENWVSECVQPCWEVRCGMHRCGACPPSACCHSGAESSRDVLGQEAQIVPTLTSRLPGGQRRGLQVVGQ